MKVLLNGLEIEQPAGLDSLTLKRVRNPRYWGFLYRRLGFVEGIGEVRFTDAAAVRLLRDRLIRDGVQAEVPVVLLTDDGRTIYDAYVNFATLRFNSSYVSCSFRDDLNTTQLETLSATPFSVTPQRTIYLSGQPLSGTASLSCQGTINLNRATPGAEPFRHALPVTKRDEREQAISGTLLSVVQPYAFDPIFENTTNRTLRLQLSGIVQVTARLSTAATATLGYRLVMAGGSVSETPLTIHALTTANQPITALLDTLIDVPAGAALAVGWLGASQNVTASYLQYSSATSLSLSEPVTLPETSARAFRVHDLLSELIRRCNPAISLRSAFFESGEGKHLYITNGACLRGVLRPLVVSLSRLFDGLNSIFNLSMDLRGGVLHIEPKSELRSRGTTRLHQISSVYYSVNQQLLPSEIRTGYTTWQGDSLTSFREPNGQRSFRTRITAIRETLDLRSWLIASGTVMEEQRRKQFSNKTAATDKFEGNDDALFIIQCDSAGRSVASPYYNESLHPAASLERWTSLLGSVLPLERETYEGGLTRRDRVQISEGQKPLIGPMLATVTAPMTMEEYGRLADWIEFHDGEGMRRGLLMGATWKTGKEGESVTLNLAIEDDYTTV